MKYEQRYGTVTIAIIATSALLSPDAMAQDCGAGLAGAQKIESAPYEIVFRTNPRKIVIGKHFSLEFAVCAKGERPPPEEVQVDAIMPEHKHGMNYKPTIKKTGADRLRADGLMFHMPGRWDLIFTVKSKAHSERLTRSIVVQ